MGNDLIVLDRKARRELEQLLTDGNTAQKIAKRARIVLMTAAGHGVVAVMREVGVSKTTVWRWQDYFAEAGIDGLVKGRSKPPGRASCQCHALERAIDGGRNGHQPHERAAHLGRTRPQAASGAQLQDIQRSRLRREGR